MTCFYLLTLSSSVTPHMGGGIPCANEDIVLWSWSVMPHGGALSFRRQGCLTIYGLSTRHFRQSRRYQSDMTTAPIVPPTSMTL